MNRVRSLVAVLAALGMLAVTVGGVAAQPPPIPSDYTGTVTIDGKPAPDGTTVQARIGTYASEPVTVKGGKYEFLIVGPLDPALQGRTITFLVGGSAANETSTLESGTSKTLNLTVGAGGGGAAPTAASTGAAIGSGSTTAAAPSPTRSATTLPAATAAATTAAPSGSGSSGLVTILVVVVVIAAAGGFLASRRIRG